MAKLILVRHSLPDIVSDVPARRWTLSEEGRRRCAPLARALDAWLPAVLASSHETKAHETARLLAQTWNVPLAVRDGLEEQHRETAPFLTADGFRHAMRTFFDKPAELVFGEETADAASARFSGAIGALLEEHPEENVVVVTHGTVIALYVAQHTGVDAFDVWGRLALPDAIILDRGDHTIVGPISKYA